MNARQYLDQVRNLDTRINNKVSELTGLRSNLFSIRSSGDLSVDRVQQSHDHDQVAALIAKIIDEESEINSMIDLLVDKKKEIIKVIEQIDDTDIYDVIHKRYVQFMRWEKISDAKHMSDQWLFELHNRGLKIIQNYLNENATTEFHQSETE